MQAAVGPHPDEHCAHKQRSRRIAKSERGESRAGAITDETPADASTWSVSQTTPANFAASKTTPSTFRREPWSISGIRSGRIRVGWANREKMEWFGDRHGGDLGTDLLGEEDGLLDGLGGEIRSVSGDQNIPEHEFSSRLCFFLTTRSVASVLDPQEP